MSWDSFFYLNCTKPQVIIHDIGYILHPSIEHFHNIPISLFSLSFKSPRYYKLFCLAQAGTRRRNDVIRRRHDGDTWHRRQQVVLLTLCSRWNNFIRANLFLLFVPQLLNQSAVVRALLKGVIRLLWLPAVQGF